MSRQRERTLAEVTAKASDPHRYSARIRNNARISGCGLRILTGVSFLDVDMVIKNLPSAI
jgi:hypothetical protein